MTVKWLGAVLIVLGCGGFGYSLVRSHRKSEQAFRQMVRMLEFMEQELQYRLTPLPELCRKAARECHGTLREVMRSLSRELEAQTHPDVCSCMTAAIRLQGDIPPQLRKVLLQLGHSLGRFDLPGQVRGLQSVRKACEAELRRYEQNADVRMRSYQTLGLCAGAALAILFV